MALKFFAVTIFFSIVLQFGLAQTITFSEVEKTDTRNVSFEILGKFSDKILVYKNVFRKHKITVYDNDMKLLEEVKLDYISDRTTNIDFIKYSNYCIIIWQYEKGNTIYCNAAKIDEVGKLIGSAITLDTTRQGFLSTKVYYATTWSEDKKSILLYKTQSQTSTFNLVSKIYNEQLILKDSVRSSLEINENRESYSDLQIDNNSNIVFYRSKENARREFINTLEVVIKKINSTNYNFIDVPLEKQLIQDPNIKIDNLNNNYILNSFSYKKNSGHVNGIFSAIIAGKSATLTQKKVNIFEDSIMTKLSGKPDWRSAYDNFYLKNIILKKDGSYLIVAEEYFKQRRFNNAIDDRFNNGFGNGFNGSYSDYYYYNRGFNGNYRSFNDNQARDITYNYNDVIISGVSNDLTLQWNTVINKTTSDVETDNFLSFSNLNTGSGLHFLFLQKDNNRQILSNYILLPNGTIVRNATLKSGEIGFDFMPRLARQISSRQIIIPCNLRNNIAFAKIEF